jgi:hypothetical protein
MRLVLARVLPWAVKKDSIHFAHCEQCREWFDRRDKGEALIHLVHQGIPETLLLLEACPNCSGPMKFRERSLATPRRWVCSRCGRWKIAISEPKQISREEYASRLDQLSRRWVGRET